ncbi:hypothetical protein HBA54_16055 [Pelagibius litoralis]|uniref:Uncharacterized protein n=1 Tax=Pelagibius litoralis TaxID=374515 RepID=A0A967EZ69_9PROT|nr:hypothetical protein [Pelagibius litoralis]NIA70120.1 hypothetical protein [Pelagibius litoralis]
MVQPMRRLSRLVGFGALISAGAIGWPAALHAQGKGYFSPTYAASAEGSPYSEVYSRTFGASGEAQQTPPLTFAPPIETAAAKPSATPDSVVYIIDSQGLLTFRSEDFAEGTGKAIAHNPLPTSRGPAANPMAPPQVPTVANSLYLQPPLETATGPAAPPPQ